MFVIRAMVRNYYETHGSFNGIERMPYYQKLQVLAKEQFGEAISNPVMEFLWSSLGYNCAMGALLPSELRKHHENLFNDALTKKEVEESRGVLSASKLNFSAQMPKKLLKLKPVDPIVDKLSSLLATHYLNNTQLIVVVDDQILTFGDYLLALSCNKKIMDVDLTIAQPVLVEIQGNHPGETFVSGSTLYTAEDVTGKEEEIQTLALEKATGKRNRIPAYFKLQPADGVLMYFKNTVQYLQLLMLCKQAGITYQQMLRERGCCLYDETSFYSCSGFYCFVFGDQAYYIHPDQTVDRISNSSIEELEKVIMLYQSKCQAESAEMGAFNG